MVRSYRLCFATLAMVGCVAPTPNSEDGSMQPAGTKVSTFSPPLRPDGPRVSIAPPGLPYKEGYAADPIEFDRDETTHDRVRPYKVPPIDVGPIDPSLPASVKQIGELVGGGQEIPYDLLTQSLVDLHF